MSRENLYLPAWLSAVMPGVVTMLFMLEMIMIILDKAIPTQKITTACLVLMVVCAILNFIIVIVDGSNFLTFFLPITMSALIIAAMVLTSWQTSMLFIVIMIVAGCALTVVNIYNTNEYMRA